VIFIHFIYEKQNEITINVSYKRDEPGSQNIGFP
jgi:hypothetical protein